MIKSAISKGGTLGTIEVHTKLGDEYRFPAMDLDALQCVIPKGSNRLPSGTPTLSLVNASFSVLSIPFQIIKAVKVNGDTWWASPV